MSRFAAAGHRVFYVAQTFRAGGPPYELRQEARERLGGLAARPRPQRLQGISGADAARDALFVGARRAATRPLARSDGRRRPAPLLVAARAAEPAQRARAGRSSTTAWTTTPASRRTAPRWSTAEKELLSAANLVVASSQLLVGTRREQIERTCCSCPTPATIEHFAGVGRGPPRAARRRLLRRHRRLVRRGPRRGPRREAPRLGLPPRRLDVRGRHEPPLDARQRSAPGREAVRRACPPGSRRLDVAILPFERLPLTEATSPVKAFEILAAGKPLVSVPLPEVAPLAPLVRLASTRGGVRARDRGGPRGRRIPTARGAAARLRAREHLGAALRGRSRPPSEALFPKRLDRRRHLQQPRLNRLCLESLYGPHRVAELRGHRRGQRLAGRHRRVPARGGALATRTCASIANGTNRGFAAANNQGLELATGDFLVLLNNDTVVTRGWLTALIRHLAAEPGSG